ncbi:MAG TPA: hypothetical protein VIP11_17330 [Gemmatimonadaceae bacterium]
MRRGTLVAILTLTVTGLACAGLGIVFDRYVLLPRQFARFRAGPPGEMRQQMRDRMARELSLTPEQQHRIDWLTARNFAALEDTRRAFQPRMDSLIHSLRASMDSVLTPAQRAKLDSLRERDAFGPPRPMRRGNPPPGLRPFSLPEARGPRRP